MKELIFDIIAVILLAVIVHITRKFENKKLSNIIIVLYLAICAFVNLRAFINAIFPDGSGASVAKQETTDPQKTMESPDIIMLGFFEQDNNLDNGSEIIEWIVLTINDNNEALVVSKYGLLYKPFEEEKIAKYWRESSLRTWLNGKFFEKSFSEKEKEVIVLQEDLVTEKSSTFYPELKDTYSDDFIFCLSIQEVNEFFNPRESRICEPTEYARTTFSGNEIEDNGDHWWLRNPGISLSSVACVRGEGQPDEKPGTINEHGSNSCGGGILVRPAMWVSLNAYEELVSENSRN